MNPEFTPQEIQEIIRSARIVNPGFSETQMQSLLELQTRLNESGYLETVAGVAQLEKEQGISLNQVLEKTRKLLTEQTRIEKQIAEQRREMEQRQSQLQELEHKQQEITQATQQALQALEELRVGGSQAEAELAEFRCQAAREKEKFGQEVEACHQQAGITRAEVALASQVKAEVEARGYSLELLCQLAREFGQHPEACRELIEALNKKQTLREYLAGLEAQVQEQKKFQDQAASQWQRDQEQQQAEVKRLETLQLNLRTGLAKLQADQAYEEDLRRFHRRYWQQRGLIDSLASWDRVYFYRCHHPADTVAGFFDASVKHAHFWTDKPVTICPHCGLKLFNYDEEAYQTLNLQLGTPIKLVLGE